MSRKLGSVILLIVLGLGSLTGLGGCGSGKGQEQIVPSERAEPTPEEQKQRQEAQQKIMQQQRLNR